MHARFLRGLNFIFCRGGGKTVKKASVTIYFRSLIVKTLNVGKIKD